MDATSCSRMAVPAVLGAAAPVAALRLYRAGLPDPCDRRTRPQGGGRRKAGALERTLKQGITSYEPSLRLLERWPIRDTRLTCGNKARSSRQRLREQRSKNLAKQALPPNFGYGT